MIYLGHYQESGKLVVLKKPKSGTLENELKFYELFLGKEELEQNVLEESVYVVKCHGYVWHEDEKFLIHDRCLCSLERLMSRIASWEENEIARVVQHCLLGLQFLERKNLVHGNISTENILLSPLGHWQLSGFTSVSKRHWESKSPLESRVDFSALGDILLSLCKEKDRQTKDCETFCAMLLDNEKKTSLDDLLNHPFLRLTKKDTQFQTKLIGEARLQILSHFAEKTSPEDLYGTQTYIGEG